MEDYIKREDIFGLVLWLGKDKFTKQQLKRMIMKIDKADVQKIRKGAWIIKNYNYGFSKRECNLCGYDETIIEGISRNYCPSCGASMEVFYELV